MRYLRWLLAIFSPGRIILIATIAAAAYLTVSASNNLLHSYKLAGDESRLREDVRGLQQQQQQLEQIRDYLRTDEYVEFMARRVFGLVEPGEALVIVDSPPAETQAPDESETQSSADDPTAENTRQLTWWERLFGQ